MYCTIILPTNIHSYPMVSYLSIHPSIHPSIYPSIHLFIYPSNPSSIHPFTLKSITHPFIHLFISSTHASTHSSHPFIPSNQSSKQTFLPSPPNQSTQYNATLQNNPPPPTTHTHTHKPPRTHVHPPPENKLT